MEMLAKIKIWLISPLYKFTKKRPFLEVLKENPFKINKTVN